jgi:hypothetical protein
MKDVVEDHGARIARADDQHPPRLARGGRPMKGEEPALEADRAEREQR